MAVSSMILELPDPAATDVLGAVLAHALGGGLPADAGLVLHLNGELGAGKTACVRSLLRALGVRGLIRSPTYTLVETYPLSALTCVHVDLYRLQSAAEVDELGLAETLVTGNVLLVEWPEKGGSGVPRADLALTLEYARVRPGSEHGRTARLEARSPAGSNWLQDLVNDSRLTPYVVN